MRTPGSAGAGLACVLVLAGCSAFSPQLPIRQADVARFEPIVAVSTGSVAKVSGTSCSGGNLVGSAFVVGDHLLLTAAHVVAGARSIALAFPGAPQVAAQLVAIDADDDTALLRVDGRLPQSLRLTTTPVAPGDPVAVAGFPIAEHVVRTGVARISAVDERTLLEGHFLMNLLVLDAEVPAGTSGGPVIDGTGGVQGMVSAQLTGRGGRDSSRLITLAVPSSRLSGRLTSWGDLPTPTPCT